MLDHDAALDEKTADTDANAEVHDEAMIRFDEAVLPQIEVREQALTARQFVTIPGAQWAGAYGELFGNAIRMQVDKIGRSLRKLENDYRQNRIVPDFRPSGGNSDGDTADTLDGLHRADSRTYGAQAGRDNAFAEMVRGGMGAYRLTNEWADPLDKDSDEQRINPGSMIVDADQSVFFDPDAKSYDKRDAKFAFVIVRMSKRAFEDAYPKATATDWPEGISRRDYPWFVGDQIAVAEYYLIEETDEDVLIFTLAATSEEQRHWRKELTADERQDLLDQGWVERKRRAKRRRCRKYVLSGAEVLEDRGFIAGANIPIVPVYGNRHYVGGVEWFTGHVQSKMDAQRGLNGAISRVARIDATSGFEKPVFAPSQMPPAIADLWARNHVDDLPYLLAMPLLDSDGKMVTPGPIDRVKPASVPDTTAALIQIHNTNLTEDDQDGADQVVANTSADAMDIAAARVDAKSGIYLDNMRQSVQREGEIYLDMATAVYVEPGRVVETMTDDGDDGEATLHEPYYDGPTLKTRNDFASGKYKVIADVTEATATRRDRTVKQMLNSAQIHIQAQDMEGALAALITSEANMDGEGLEDFLAWNRKRALSMGLAKPNEDEQREMAEQAEGEQQKPDPAAVVAEAQANALNAGAEKDKALTVKAVADTKVSEATVTEKNARANDLNAQAGLRPIQAANDQHNQTIKFGRELAQ